MNSMRIMSMGVAVAVLLLAVVAGALYVAEQRTNTTVPEVVVIETVVVTG